MVGLVDLRAALAEPRVRLGVGIATLLATAGAVHRDRVGACEARTFRAVNGLPDALYPPAWIVMQMGAFGAVPASAFTAWRAGDGELAARLLLGGTSAWALSTSRAERRWDWPLTRRRAWSRRGTGRGALLGRRPAPAA